jgi:glycosyltransferase involved in cell wall biosynthesis
MSLKVSVIVTNYNYACYLPAAIDSVLSQTYPDTEIIIVDDGSTDNSREVITQIHRQLPDKISPIFQENQGQAAAFNTGFEIASGEIVAFLDADDIWKPNKLQRVVEALSHPDVVGLMHQFDHVDSNGNFVDIESNSPTQQVLTEDLARLLIETGSATRFPPTSALAYRRSAIAKIMPIDPLLWRLCADGPLIFCTAFLGKIKTLNEVLMSYRIHGLNNYANKAATRERLETSLAGVEMTNQYINDFLERIGYPERVDLSHNLDYRRARYYLQEKWDIKEIQAISGSILRWPFYTPLERVAYLVRFLIKSAGFLIRPISGTGTTNS